VHLLDKDVVREGEMPDVVVEHWPGLESIVEGEAFHLELESIPDHESDIIWSEKQSEFSEKYPQEE